ncbi:MAG: L-serine ammonia-lyase, iron-sulfur-dependent, subunit alpha [Spirochaetia bacterium]|nr:L-serine ammonia-lyase, iron-sulfur-dependent, subunit alpha [Spirochaetia bacterium]
MNQFPSVFNHALGPVAPGPSSSNTAAPYRIGKLVWQITGETPAKIYAELATSTSFARTYLGSKSDLAMICGLLNKELNKFDITKGYKEAKKAGLEITFDTASWEGLGTLKGCRLTVTRNDGSSVIIIADSTGGGTVEILSIDGFPVSIKGDCYELLIFAKEIPDEMVKEIIQEKMTYTITENSASHYLLNIKSTVPFVYDEIQEQLDKYDGIILRSLTIDPVHPVVCQGENPPFQTATEMCDYCDKNDLQLWQAAIKYESAISGWTEKQVFNHAKQLWQNCMQSIKKGLKGNFSINGIITPKANIMAKKFNSRNSETFPLGILDTALPVALGIMEYSNSAGIIVCIPTGGSAGIVPAAIYSGACSISGNYLNPDENLIIKAFLAAGAIGVCMAQKNNFSGGALGCQAEIGSGAAMASAALVQMLGGTVKQSCDAASMTIQCLSGLICDPVAGTVQVPCIARNLSATATAFVSANSIMAGFEAVIPLEEMCDAMITTGNIIRACKGIGATTTPTGKRLAAELTEKYNAVRKV